VGHTTVPATRRPLPEALARDGQHCILGGVNSGTRFFIKNVSLVSALGWLYQEAILEVGFPDTMLAKVQVEFLGLCMCSHHCSLCD
jgi:hypothetical protein